ncbi:hypothetical protein PIB30_014304 [Stylosanthes scabra]|uniref:Uncharacterized protein n=1 Tax=Stylosanthes scabra TaxID=79078 RepID=A0ABU6V615_9FABA|nr:hypothetical protein [Stylosanthes scabra]
MEPHMKLNEETIKSPSSKRLINKVAVITGGARGIGAATAKLFAENGAHVVIADVLDDLGASLAESIAGRFIHCDVSKEQDVESAINLALSWKGQLDIMFNNAGIAGVDGSITSLDMEHVRSAACELGVHLIRVNSISPHGVPSEMLLSAFKRFGREISPQELGEYIGKNASLLKGKGSTAEDVAHAALFLACDESSFITAHTLRVDGGYTSAFSHMSFIYQDLK